MNVNQDAAIEMHRRAAAGFPAYSLDRRIAVPLIVVAAALLLAAASMARSAYDGRFASPMTHDDVNYFIIGIRRLVLLRTNGFLGLLDYFIHYPEHSPFLTYQATLAFLIFGINDWAPYVSNISLILVFLGVGAYLVRDCPVVLVAACMASLIALPMSSNLVVEFSPEVVCSLFTAIAVVLMLRLPLLDAPLGARFRAGLCFGLGYFAHPVAFPFTTIALLGTVGWIFLRDIIIARQYKMVALGIRKSALNMTLSLWLPVLYLVPSYEIYWQYFDRTILNPATSWRWALPTMGLRQQIAFYLTGPGGDYMLGKRFWICSGIIGAGLAAAWWRGDRRSLVSQAELILLAALFWLVPTLAPIKNGEYASCFGFALAFLSVMGLRSIFEVLGGAVGALAVWALAFLMLVSDVSHQQVPNTPKNAVDREFAFGAIDRLEAVLFGNAADYQRTKVYMTNTGAYATNILQYYMMKVDPSLSWQFDGGYFVSDPNEQLDLIRSSRQDFVIAGHRDNGFTYSDWAQPAEEPVLAALSHDPGYMPIDRFYGPHGRTVTVFQRRGNFAGWRPTSGIANPSAEPDGVRVSTGGLAYLQTYAARAVGAELHIECTGTPGQMIAVFVNQRRVAELTLSAEDGTGSLVQPIALTAGSNDIVLQYPSGGKLTLHRLLIVPDIVAEE